MRIGILGTGNMASGLAAAFAKAGHEIAIGSRDPSKAAQFAGTLGEKAQGGGMQAAVKFADIVVLALPYQAILDTIDELGDLAGKVLVDISNPITADFRGLVVGHVSSAAEEIQARTPGSKVVKAFNTIFAALLPADARKGHSVQVFVAGDDEQAKAAVSDLVASIGFEPVESGALSNARFIEPIGEMNIHFGFFHGRGTAIAPAWIHIG